MKKTLWIDTETTGLNPRMNGIHEIAFIIEIDGIELEKNVFQIDPRTYNKEIIIDSKALEISNKRIADFNEYDHSAYVFDKFLKELEKYIDKDDKDDFFILAGYNTKFDNDFVFNWFCDNNAMKDWNKYIHYKLLDVFSLVISFKYLDLIFSENDKLETICKYLNIEINAHNALSDIVATKEVFQSLSKNIGVPKCN